MKKFVFGLLAIASTASASDFSALGRPEVVRAYLLPQPRQMEKQCAAFALARGDKQQVLSASQRTELLDSVTARMAIDIGNADVAKSSIYDFAQGLVDSPFDIFAENRAATIKALRAHCAPFFDKVKSVGVARALSSAPTGLVSLPDGPTCLAAMQEADRRKLDLGQDQGTRHLERMLFTDPPPADQQANRAALARAAAKLAARPPEKDYLEMTINFACMPAYAALAKRYPPPAELEP